MNVIYLVALYEQEEFLKAHQKLSLSLVETKLHDFRKINIEAELVQYRDYLFKK